MSNAPDWLKPLAEHAKGFQFGPGVVGKTAYHTAGAVIAWLLVIPFISDNLARDTFLFGSALVATVFVAIENMKTRKFAAEHPEVALLENARLLEWKKFEEQSKHGQVAANSPRTTNPTNPVIATDDIAPLLPESDG
jgi:hypothetical protein